MATLKQLIDQLCPDGVEYVRLGDVFGLRNGYTPSRQRADFWQSGTVPWFRMDDIRQNGRVLDSSIERVTESAIKGGRLFPANSVILATSATIGEHALVTTEFMCNQRFTVLQPKEDYVSELNPKFVFYVGYVLGEYCRENVNEGNFKSVSMPSLRDFRFPLPPREVQDKIVEYLDAFAALCENLDTEIEQREQQFAEYREKLLSADYLAKRYAPDGVDYVRLGDVAVNFDRLRKPVSAKDRKPGHFPYYGANGVQDWVDDFILEGEFVLVGEDGSVMRKDGTPFVHWATGKIWVNNHAHILACKDESLSLRFLYHAINIAKVSDFVTGGTQPKINQKNLNQISIPLPPREAQDELVAKLDVMQALIDNLRLERAQRQQQFDFYREKLLTFAPKEASEV